MSTNPDTEDFQKAVNALAQAMASTLEVMQANQRMLLRVMEQIAALTNPPALPPSAPVRDKALFARQHRSTGPRKVMDRRLSGR